MKYSLKASGFTFSLLVCFTLLTLKDQLAQTIAIFILNIISSLLLGFYEERQAAQDRRLQELTNIIKEMKSERR